MCDGNFIAVAEETLEQKLLVRHHVQSNTEICGRIPTDSPGCPSQCSFVMICILVLELLLVLFVCLFFLFMQDLFLTASALFFSILILAAFSSLDSLFLDFSCRCLIWATDFVHCSRTGGKFSAF